MRAARAALLLVAGTAVLLSFSAARAVVIDDFDDSTGRWTAHPSDGVSLTLASDAGGRTGRALRLDVDFQGHAGYAVIRREVALDLPENYRFTFAVRGDVPSENLEFKLIDSTGDNVWWLNRRDFEFPRDWQTVVTPRRRIQFAWGPQGGGEIRHVAAIEIAVTAGNGGRGSVWIDDLALEELPPRAAAMPRPRATASSSLPGYRPAGVVDTLRSTSWRSVPGDTSAWIALDFGASRELGGLVVDWDAGLYAADYHVEASPDGVTWEPLRAVRGANGGRDYIALPDAETRHLRLRIRGPRSYGIRGLRFEPVEWSENPNAIFESIARDAPRGRYPRSFRGEQVYWTVIGADGDDKEALLSEDGALEPWKAGFSIEPFLYAGGRLLTWADGPNEQTMEAAARPIPSVTWRRGDLELRVTAVADGYSIRARYRVTNRSGDRVHATLFLALRPFQVNPPTQFLGIPGGVTTIRSVEARGRVARVDGRLEGCPTDAPEVPAIDRYVPSGAVESVTEPTAFGAATFDEGDITEYLAEGRLPGAAAAKDPRGRASGAFEYRLDLAPRTSERIDVCMPLCVEDLTGVAVSDSELFAMSAETRARTFEGAVETAHQAWKNLYGSRWTQIELPRSAADVRRTLQAQAAYMTIEDLEPGTRAYDRFWIRDGSLMASALLRLGSSELVRDRIRWYAQFQFPNGKTPCCVDARGADPVPEHDSAGEFIFLVAEYYRHMESFAWINSPAASWEEVYSAAAYLDSLRRIERTSGTPRAFFGLLPPSISHEGYSAKPMHSYWDNFWAYRGFKDVVYLAPSDSAGRAAAARFASVRDEFARDLAASIKTAMAEHHIDYVPGCADLGDFDATSTAIALAPCDALDLLPPGAAERTFERYWEFFDDRRAGRTTWSDFTPYEMRVIGAFVRLGWRERANALLDWFMRFRRPAGWMQWAEVVGRDPRKPRFIGDMPHAWVGAEYVRAVLDMLAYESERDSSIVIAAGVPMPWAREDSGLAVRELVTSSGFLTYSLRVEGRTAHMRIEQGLVPPPGGLVLRPPLGGPARSATVNGRRVPLSKDGAVVVREVPAVVEVRW